MKIIKTSNPREIEWLAGKGYSASDPGVFEVEEDVIIPNFSEPEISKKIGKKEKFVPKKKKK